MQANTKKSNLMAQPMRIGAEKIGLLEIRATKIVKTKIVVKMTGTMEIGAMKTESRAPVLVLIAVRRKAREAGSAADILPPPLPPPPLPHRGTALAR